MYSAREIINGEVVPVSGLNNVAVFGRHDNSFGVSSPQISVNGDIFFVTDEEFIDNENPYTHFEGFWVKNDINENNPDSLVRVIFETLYEKN